MEAQAVSKWGRWKGVFVIGGAIVVVAVIAVITVSFLSKGKSGKRQVVHQISIMKPPPPPPPKPPEKPPEPEMKKQEVKLPEPNKAPEPQKAEAPPPSQNLGVAAQGTGDGDSFGLVGNPGGKDITTIGGGGGGKDSRFTRYSDVVNGFVTGEIQKMLGRDQKLRSVEFKVVVKIWVGTGGKTQRAELVTSSGDAKTDELIKGLLADMPTMREGPPPEMPQPVTIRVTSRY